MHEIDLDHYLIIKIVPEEFDKSLCIKREYTKNKHESISSSTCHCIKTRD